jgi:phage terminase large subunit-like protein
MGLRLGQHPRQIFTTTPRPLKQIRDLIADPATIVTRGNTFDNARNLAPTFIAKIRRRYEGTRYGRQELYAEILDDMPGALWTRALIEACYLRPYETTPFPIHLFRRIVIGVDPAVSNNEGSDETGIVVAGTRVQDDHMVVIDDASGRYSPIEWAQKVVKLYRQYKADKIVAEVNNGGDLVETTLRIVDPNLPVKKVHARKGKFTRAEPISALYERGEAHHLGAFPILEDQLCQFTSDLDVKSLGYSPDRADAMVWAATELKVEEGDGTAVIEFYRGLVSGKKNDLVFPPL